MFVAIRRDDRKESYMALCKLLINVGMSPRTRHATQECLLFIMILGVMKRDRKSI